MVTLTESATQKLAELLAQQGETIAGLRLTVAAGGCSGYQYGMSFTDAEQPGDWVGTFGTVKVYVDAQAQQVLNGVEVDWIETLQQTGFAIRNPNAVRSCGCGKSFETH